MKNKVESSYRPLAGVISERQRILTSDSFLRIGQEVGADALELVARIPGDKKPKLLRIYWDKNAQAIDPQVVPFSSLKDPIIKNVLDTGSEVIWSRTQGYVNDSQSKRLEEIERAGSLAAIPLILQGDVTGCVCIRSEDQRGFSRLDISKVRDFAQIAALVVHGERELSAAERFSSNLIRWRVKMDVMSNSEAIQGIAEILLDVLSAAAVIIHLNVGFKSYIQIAGDGDDAEMIRKEIVEEDLPSVMNRLATSMEIVEADLLDVSYDEREESIRVGKLYVIASEKAVLTRGSSYSLAPTFATLITDAVLNAVRDGFHSLNKRVGVALSDTELVDYSQWFNEVEKIAIEARLIWAVATHLGDDKFYGDPKWVEIVQACLKGIEFDPNSGRIIGLAHTVRRKEAVSDDIDLIWLSDPDIGKHTVLSVYLPHTNARVWFGVGREGFGAELSTLSPWTVFLYRLAEHAESALLRLSVQRQMQSAETRNLAAFAVLGDTIFHQIANMVRDIVNPISSIKEALAVGDLKANDEVVDLIKLSDRSAERLLDFAFMFMNVNKNKMDTHRPCSLLQAVKESKELFEFSLKSNQISLNINIAEDLSIDVPFNVALLTFANLISNAKDAIGRHGGKIWIEAENAGDMIHCYVMNDGPPVDPRIKDRIFQHGVTTKQGQDIHGWGLYLVYRSLIENRGHIELTSSNDDETKFTIRFPHVRQEQA
jgi:signal transduction histidine kinase